MDDKTPIYYLLNETAPLSEQDISSLISSQLRNFREAAQMQSGFFQSGNFVSGTSGWQILPNGNVEFNAGTFRGALTANSIDIPNTTTANSFHVDTSGNAWWGATTFAAGVASVSKAGAAIFTSGTVGGFTMTSTTLSATNFTVTSGAANTANLSVGTGSNLGGINSANGSTDIVFWAGDTFANRATAPFRVTAAGVITSTPGNNNISKFGGTGTDGALSISSGTTTLSAASAQVLTKNYTSISITGTATLTISNAATSGTILVLRSQGAVTLTSTTPINLAGFGGVGGAAGTGTGDGSDGTTGVGNVVSCKFGGKTLGGGVNSPGGTAGTGPQLSIIGTSYGFPIAPGGGGGGAGKEGGAQTAPGAGGNGGGALIIECAGAYNATGILTCAGNVGTDAGTLSNNQGAGGGGGGGGGSILVLYTTLTADSATYTVTGGAGGAKTDSLAGQASGGGGGGAGLLTDGTAGTAAANGGTAAGGGGAGGNGASFRAVNNFIT